MQKFLLLLCSCVAIVEIAAAQDRLQSSKAKPDVEAVKRLSILSPGFGYELPVGKHQTLYFNGYIATSWGVGYGEAVGFTSFFHLQPTLSLEYRYFYNYERRMKLGRRVDMNSANYFSPFFETALAKRYYIDTEGELKHKRRPVHTAGIVWGLQRNFRQRFSLDLNIGAGYIFKEKPFTDEDGLDLPHNGSFTIPGRFSLGIWLN